MKLQENSKRSSVTVKGINMSKKALVLLINLCITFKKTAERKTH